MKPPSCNIAMAVQVNSRAHGVRYLKFHTSSMSSDDGSLRKKALSLQDWLDADGRPSTSEHTPDDTVSLAVAAPCQKRFQRLFYPVGNKGGGKKRSPDELKGDISELCKVCLRHTFPFKDASDVSTSHFVNLMLRRCRQMSWNACQTPPMPPHPFTASRRPAIQMGLTWARSGPLP